MDWDLKECYQDLANAVVERAVEDYRYVLTGFPIKDNRVITVESLEKFFRSEWFKALTRVDGEYIIEKVRKELEQ